jgi:hypothetical protein
VIYCVVPQALADDLYDKLVDYYKDDPNVKVIVDRRAGIDRRSGTEAPEGEQREIRDRRRTPLTGSAPADAPGQ